MGCDLGTARPVGHDPLVRILITSPIFPPDLGGPATYVPSLATWLTERGHQVTVVCFCSDPDPQGWPFKVVAIPRAWMPLRYLRHFLAVLRELRHAELLYINEHLAFLVALAGRLTGKRMVIRVMVDSTWEITHRLGWHRDTITDYQFKTYGWRVAWTRRIQRLWWSWVDRIITPSNFLRNIVLGYGVNPQRVELIHNAYHGPSEFEPSRDACRERLGLPPGRVVLLSICRLMIWKGVDGLIRALQQLPENHHLYVAGDGDQELAWKKVADDLGLSERVHFLGNVPHGELMAWIRAADCFLLNSQYEGLSHTLLEVMWLGLPAAVSDVCGNPELIEDRVNGRTFAPHDIDGIVAAIRDLLADPEQTATYVQRGLDKVANFSREKTFARKEALFLSVLGQSAPTALHPADAPADGG
jgi:glycosyltransferase involved in cell wall biosynthesis